MTRRLHYNYRLPVEHHDAINFDHRGLWQRYHLHGRSSWKRFCKILCHYFVHGREITEVVEIDSQFGHLGERPARRFSYCTQILEHLICLLREVSRDEFHAVWDEWYLTGEIHRLIDSHRLRIGANCAGRVVRAEANSF